MNQNLMRTLEQIAGEEQEILDGRTQVRKTLYTAGSDFTIDSRKMLEKGRLIDIRTHTRFIDFPRHRHNYIEIMYMCRGCTTHIINNGDRVTLETGDLLFMNQHCSHEVLPAGKDDIGINFIILPEFWQGDDVVGFDAKEALSGGIQTTGNYPGKATTPEQLMADFDEVLRLTPGKKKLNLHASYAIFEGGEFADRDAIQPKHFSRWVVYAKERGLGIDFNPTFFSHSMVKDGLTLSSPDETVRKFWVEHGKRCMAIAEYFAEETGKPCVINFWIPDGYKDYPADRLSPRRRYAQSMDEILSVPYDKTKVFPCIESKVFGIGLEAYTVGSAEFCTNYVNTRHITPLMDNGHYHPTELVSDKISSMLLFNDRLALHITRPMRWDSDHVVLFDDETREMMKEVVRADALDRVFLATDYFDASSTIR